jgi:hypothetical protein
MNLEKMVNESKEVLNSLRQSQPQPINKCTAFANYVRDSKFKKVMPAINKVLTHVMEEGSENEEETQASSKALSCMPPPSFECTVRTTHLSPSPSELYQPPPHIWRHNPPQSSVWTLATQEYMEQYIHQPLQPHQQ